MDIKEQITNLIKKVLEEMDSKKQEVILEIPSDMAHGDYTTNSAFLIAKALKKTPMEVAEEMKEKIEVKLLGDKAVELGKEIEKVEAVKPGFINFYLSQKYYIIRIQELLHSPEKIAGEGKMKDQRILVEFAHPNTHKEMHIGHMRTLITGEALCRLLESQGAKVFRANYQGDIGPHVAKALYGIEQIMQERNLQLGEIRTWSNYDKAHFLGEGYVRGNKDYEQAKIKIDEINATLYKKKPGYYWDLYNETHQWSMDYYDEFYQRFYTKFDRLFLESEMVECGMEIVKNNIGNIFLQDDDGSIIFPGEKYGLHRRVFITQAGYPTYEGKEMCNGFEEYEAFPFTKKIHVVASEQIGYFQVALKALELLDPKKFKDKQYHLPMGMVHLTDRKMSSRTGDILTVDWLIKQVKDAASSLFKDGKISEEEKQKVLEQISIGAVKYSVLKVNTKQDAAFDIQKSVSLDGDSGPYIQYSYSRTQSVLGKSGLSASIQMAKAIGENDFDTYIFHKEELELMRIISHYADVLRHAAFEYAPNVLSNYLFTLAKSFNLFYQKHRILDAKSTQKKQLRLSLVYASGIVLGNGLYVLGIAAPQKM